MPTPDLGFLMLKDWNAVGKVVAYDPMKESKPGMKEIEDSQNVLILQIAHF
jgi:hypothetical protein